MWRIHHSRRCMSSSSRALGQAFSKTTLNPTKYQLISPTAFTPKSLILLSTPSNLPQIIGDSINIHQKHNIQVIVAGIDGMVPNWHRNGISELWMDEMVKIKHSVQLDVRDDLNTQPHESDGINIVVARKNWKSIDSRLKVELNSETNVEMQLANTVFSTGNMVTLFYLQPESSPESSPNSGQTLCELSIELPSGILKEGTQVSTTDKWEPLYDYSTEEPFYISNCIGNLVKEVNEKSAAGYLESNNKLMSIGSKDTQVFVKIYPQNHASSVHKYEVIAGGGGWGSKANIIALSPEAKLSKGDRVEFYMLTPTERFSKALNNISLDKVSNSFIFESSYEELGYEQESNESQTEVPNLFGCGCEEGYILDGVRHLSAGERLIISL